MSVGFAPAANLLYQAGAKMRYDSAVEQFVPDVAAGRRVRRRPGERRLCARRSSCATASARDCEAAQHLGRALQGRSPAAQRRDAPAHASAIRVFAHPEGKNFVDFDEDLQLKDLLNAAQEGFDNIELLKRYSTVGMGPSQGKHSQHERGAHPGADPRRAGRAGRHHHRAAVLPSGADVAPGRARLHAGAAHAAAQPPRGARRGVDAGRRLAAARVLRASRQEQGRVRARGGARRAQRSSASSTSARWARSRCSGPTRLRSSSASTRALRQPEGRHDALRRDARRERRGDRRRRRRPAGGAALLLHDHDHRLGDRLSRAACA